MVDGVSQATVVGVIQATAVGNQVVKLASLLSKAGLLFNYKNKRSIAMYYYPFYRSFGYGYPYGGYPFGGYPFGNYGTAINAIGSQFNNQSLINTGVATGISQVFTPTNIY